jgi:hypothetical protein
MGDLGDLLKMVFVILALTLVIAAPLAALTSCGPEMDYDDAPPAVRQMTRWSSIERYVDVEARVVCWVYTGNEKAGLSCLPLDQTRLEVNLE